jgi:Holliday junction resolvase
MARTPEGKVKDKIVKQLKVLGAYYFFPATGGYGKSGVPDIIICFRGKFIAIECKAGNNKCTTLQRMNLDAIKEAGGIAVVINEENVETVSNILSSI